eukprot:TRINITY_DN37935_c0_g1_i1.p1 TRINITY_DN37935_c0_g1~~TRINITY_DN37935_c0_g1_i1.p1  ORF type:complete len:332 (+),score=28.17 TRINITY_DN37935_c0_g1_i1:326-1321(+)
MQKPPSPGESVDPLGAAEPTSKWRVRFSTGYWPAELQSEGDDGSAADDAEQRTSRASSGQAGGIRKSATEGDQHFEEAPDERRLAGRWLTLRKRLSSFVGRSFSTTVHSPVTLHVYDVTSKISIRRLNNVCRLLGTGAYHAAVEVYGKEWSYGFTAGYGTTGVFWCEPRECGMHQYREPIHLGYTTLTQGQVKQVLVRLSAEWLGPQYDLLRRNCCHFSDAFARELGVGGAPEWVLGLADFGAKVQDTVDDTIGRVEGTITRGKEWRHGRANTIYRVGDFTRGLIALGEADARTRRPGRSAKCLFWPCDCFRGLRLFWKGEGSPSTAGIAQ